MTQLPEVAVGSLRFSNPPVRAVTLTVEFEDLHTLQVSDIADLIARWKIDYPRVVERAPRPSSTREDVVTVEGAWPFPLLLLANADDTNVVALQSNQIARTWRFQGDQRGYPGFEVLRDELADLLSEFAVVADREGEGLRLTGAEAIYTNDLAVTAEQTTRRLLTGDNGPESSFGSSAFGLRAHFCNEDWLDGCSLEIFVDNDHDDGSTLTLRASTAPKEDATDEVDELGGLDRAHKLIIAGFSRFSDHNSWEEWGLQT